MRNGEMCGSAVCTLPASAVRRRGAGSTGFEIDRRPAQRLSKMVGDPDREI
jgi:hypothetical protein